MNSNNFVLLPEELKLHLSPDQKHRVTEFCNEMWSEHMLSQTAVADCIYQYICMHTPKDMAFNTAEAYLLLNKYITNAIGRFRKESRIYEKIKAMEISENDYMPAFK